MKSILVIGMGKFGHHLVNQLIENGKNEVMIIDQKEDNIKDIYSKVTSARVGDCTKPEVLNALGVKNFDVVIVCIGEDFQSSLEVTSLVKEMGAPYVISMASRDIHAKFLLKNGADEVVYPERDLAKKVAAKVSANNIYDFIALTDEYSIYEIPVIKKWLGKSIKEANVRAVHNINIIAVGHGDGIVDVMPGADYIFQADDHVKVLATKQAIDVLLKQV